MTKKAKISPLIRETVLFRDGHRCRYCGSTDGPFEIDHVYPESKGGVTSTDNLVTACLTCNRRKSAKIGIWPKPIGYFLDDPRRQSVSLAISLSILGLILTSLGGVGVLFSILATSLAWLPLNDAELVVVISGVVSSVGFGFFLASKIAWRRVYQQQDRD